MSYRVCIPCAGIGSRLNDLTKYLNKSLVTLSNKPIISHIIEKFSSDTEFVIALGYKGDLVKDFLELAYPEKVFIFVDVNPYDGQGSGLGLSLIKCKDFLQEPFVFISCDTLVEETIPEPVKNWMGYSYCDNYDEYRTIDIKDSLVISINDKLFNNINNPAYIGLAGIANYKEFWDSMVDEKSISIEVGESHGLKSLLDKNFKIYAENFTWHDVGNMSSLNVARNYYHGKEKLNILEKSNESIWFVSNKVIKFSADNNFIFNRAYRAQKLIDYVPDLIKVKKNMFSYYKINGDVVSENINLPLFKNLLEFSIKFWKQANMSNDDKKDFDKLCLSFYYSKTLERIQLFYENNSISDNYQSINGIKMPTLLSLLNTLNWNWISDSIPCRFHGDFHFENILWDCDNKEFVFLDWRQDFAGNLEYGDQYYDLAKLLHGMIINHGIISENLYHINWNQSEISFNFHRLQNLIKCEEYFYEWLDVQGFDKKKVITITALIFLNISPLHHYPYSLLLYALGKEMLFNLQNNIFDI